MPPYERDAGMTEREAENLAEIVRAAGAGSVVVEPEGQYFVVTVQATSGQYTVREEADWTWLRRRVFGGGG